MARDVKGLEDEPKVGLVRQGVTYYHSVIAEMRKVTWPDRGQVRSATISIIIFVLAIGALISIMDAILTGVLQHLIPSLFAGR